MGMDLQFKDAFQQKWARHVPGAALPLALFYSDDARYSGRREGRGDFALEAAFGYAYAVSLWPGTGRVRRRLLVRAKKAGRVLSAAVEQWLRGWLKSSGSAAD